MKISDFSIPKDAYVDIVVRAKNGHEMTRNCLQSIIANTPRELFRLILIDDGSEPPQETDLVDIATRLATSHGAVTASNLGMAMSLTRKDSQYVLILDNDVLVPEGDRQWLERMIAALEEGGEDCAAVGATTNFANPPQHILVSPQTYTHDWEEEKTGRMGIAENPEVPWFVSFAVLLRKTAIEEVGFWDEQYNPGNYEDTDYAVQLREAGWQIRVAHSVYLHHLGHQTFQQAISALLAENKRKFYLKWGMGRLFDLGFIAPQELRRALP